MTEMELLEIICNNNSKLKNTSRYLRQDSKLIRQNLLQVKDTMSYMNRSELATTEELKIRLCGEIKQVKSTLLSSFLTRNNTPQLVKVEQSIDDLILPKQNKALLISLTSSTSHPLIRSSLLLQACRFLQCPFLPT